MKFIIPVLIFFLIIAESVFPQFYFFGRNKVQYEEFNWKVLYTDHFDIYYYSDMDSIAEIGATYAETAYERLKIEFRNIITRKIPLIFYNSNNHFQQTNTTPGFIPEGVGGFFEFMKGRVVIPFSGSLPSFKHVITHELVHVFMMNKIFRIIKDHRSTSDLIPPLWFVEGLAEYFSNEWDAQSEMVLRDALLNDGFAGLKEIYKISGSYLMYKEGESFLHFIAEKYGRHQIIAILENVWMDSNFENVIEYTLMKKIDVIDAEWKQYLRKRFFPLLSSLSSFKEKSEALTEIGFCFSPVIKTLKGKTSLFFIGNLTGYSSVYKIDYNSKTDSYTKPILLFKGEQTAEYESFHLMQQSMDVSNNGLIAFVTKSGSNDVVHIYSLDAKQKISVISSPKLITISSPKFSPNGNHLLFEGIDEKGFSDLYLAEITNILNKNSYDSSYVSLMRLTNDYYKDEDPSFISSDLIVFSSDRTSGANEKKHNLFKLSLIDSSIYYLTNLPYNLKSPIITENGHKILFLADIDRTYNIWEIDLHKNSDLPPAKRVTNFISSVFHYTLSIDSTIYFSGFEDFSYKIYSTEYANGFPDDTSSINIVYNNKPETNSRWKEYSYSGLSDTKKADYEKEYTLDYAASQVSTDPIYGTRGGAVFAVSDLLGDENYYFLLYNTAEVQSDFLRSFNISLSKVFLGERANYGFGIFHFRGRRYDIRESDEYFFERSFGGTGLLNFPFSKFSRLETAITIANSDKQLIDGMSDRKALLWSNSISYVFDNSLWAYSGPIDGSRLRLSLAYTSDIKYSNVNYFSIIADFREYLRLSQRTSLAFRTSLYFNSGKEARRYFMGGSWDLRGWDRWSIRGEKMWFSSLEFRFPLIDEIRIRLPIVELGFFGIRGAFFYDMGNAWDEEYKETMGSIGGGIRINLFNVICFRYDIGKKIEKNFSEFQEGLFYQFFFGWDF